MNPPLQLKLKTAWTVILFATALLMPSCNLSSGMTATATVNTPMPSRQSLKTTLGEFIVVSTRLVEEVHDSKAPDGYNFLLISLTGPNQEKLIPGEFSLENFQSLVLASHDEIYVSGNDGSQTYYSQMGGWVDEDFVMGFTVPNAETYTLHWPDNTPIPLTLEK